MNMLDVGARLAENGAMSELPGQTRRVFVEDIRRNGKFLRCSWHRDDHAFVLSTWDRDVCVSSARLGPDDASQLISGMAAGLADAVRHPQPATDPVSLPATHRATRPQRLRMRLNVFLDTARSRVARSGDAEVIELKSQVAPERASTDESRLG
ncbi:MAG: hypothetical protein ACI8TP_001477 [Acidimicrobiales bacterium]|jgi:hypothetical protein